MLTDCLSTQKEQLLIKKTWAISALSKNLGESEFIYSNSPISGVRSPESLNQSPELALTDLLRLGFLTIFHILSLRPLGPEFGHLSLPS